MKTRFVITCLLLTITVLNSFGQMDTLITNNEKIPCTIREVTEVAVKYSYPGEDLVNSVYKNTVQRIVMKNGRVQTFVEATSFKKVSGVRDFENVSMTSVFTEVQGLYKIGDVSSKAKGTTTVSNQDRVKERAYRKLKIEAAMMGGNIIYLSNQRSDGNIMGGKYQSGVSAETSLTGVVYSNTSPSYDDFKKLVGDRSTFYSNEQYSLWSGGADFSQTSLQQTLHVHNVSNVNGEIVLEGQLVGVPKYTKFKVAYITPTSFSIYYQDKNTAHSIRFTL